MQPGEPQRGVSGRGELFDSLKVYLDNKKRLQPIIGLGSIVECVKAGTRHREALYLCEVCVCRLSKADMRNHIMGSLHRFNYVKAGHPDLVSEWKDDSDLSKLAWPLMEMAKMIEGDEGPGDVQLLEVGDALYQKMTTLSEKNAVTLINYIRDWQGEPQSHSEATSPPPEQRSVQSQRIVFLGQNQNHQSHGAEVMSHETPGHTTGPQSVNTRVSPEPPVPSEISSSSISSLLGGYTGATPLIGLFRVVECRSDTGRAHGFLCHCCRIRFNRGDVVDHLTSSSHLINYLMEARPEQVDVSTADVNDDCQFLQSLAKEVEREEGRGELKVINVPESLGIPLTGKSYHWCMKMLCNGWTDNSSQKNKLTVRGHGANEASAEDTAVLSKWSKRPKRKMMKKANTVFKVSLPLTKGALLLKRTSFTKDGVPVSRSHTTASELIPSAPEPKTEDTYLECDTESFAVDQAEHPPEGEDPCGGDVDAGQYVRPERNYTVTLFQEGNGYVSNNECFSRSKDLTGTNEHVVYGDENRDGQRGSRERSRENVGEELKREGLQRQCEGLSRAVSHTEDWSSHTEDWSSHTEDWSSHTEDWSSHTEDWSSHTEDWSSHTEDRSSHTEDRSSYSASYGCGRGVADRWYSSAAPHMFGARAEERRSKTSLDATQHYYRQPPPNHHMAADHSGSLLTGSGGYHSSYGGVTAHSHAAGVDVLPYNLAHSGSVAPETRVHSLGTEQRQAQNYMEFTTTTSNVQTGFPVQPVAYHGVQTGHGMMRDPAYSNGPWAQHDSYFPYPERNGGGGGGGGMYQSNTFSPPVQTPCYGTHYV